MSTDTTGVICAMNTGRISRNCFCIAGVPKALYAGTTMPLIRLPELEPYGTLSWKPLRRRVTFPSSVPAKAYPEENPMQFMEMPLNLDQLFSDVFNAY